MNTNYLKRRQVVSAGKLQNNSDKKKTESDEIDQTSCSRKNETIKGGAFLKFCKDNAHKFFQEKALHNSNLSTDSGK